MNFDYIYKSLSTTNSLFPFFLFPPKINLLSNDKYKLDFISTLQDEDGLVTLENTVNLINLSWISSPSRIDREFTATMNPNNSKFSNSIFEAINYARKISKTI
jgi:hypothetical protein